MKSFLSNLSFGFRLSARDPLTTILCVMLLSFGIALTSVIYQHLKFAVFMDLPVEEADAVVAIRRANLELDQSTMWWDVESLNNYSDSTQSFSAYSSVVPDVVSLDNGERFSTQRAVYVQADFFGVFPADLIMGRAIVESDTYADATPVIMINEQVWEEQFNRDPSILGQSVVVDGTRYSIVGVTSWNYSYPFSYTLWIPLNFGTIEVIAGRKVRCFAVGRLNDDVTASSAGDEANSIMRKYFRTNGKSHRFNSVRIVPFIDLYTDEDRKSFGVLLFFIALLVLLMASTNVVGLMMNQLFKRTSELAIRSALGANRKMILFQLLTESLTMFCLVIAGSLLGVYFYFKWIFEPMKKTEFALPRWLAEKDFFDLKFYLFLTVITILTVLLSQLLPALRATGKNLNVVMNDNSRTGSGLKLSLFSKWVVIIQLALSAVILTTASLYLSSQRYYNEASKIYSTESFIHANVGLDGIHFPEESKRLIAYDSLMKELLQYPEIESVAITNESATPWRRVTVSIDGVNYTRSEDRPRLFHRICSVGAFESLGIQLLSGREFTEKDSHDAPLVAVVTESTVERFWPNENPIGKHFSMESSRGVKDLIVVGVVEDLWSKDIFEENAAGFIRPLAQETWGNVGLYVKSRGNYSTVESFIRETGRKVNPYMAIMNIQPLSHLDESSVATDRFLFVIFSSLSLGSVLMLSTGLYGILNNVANNRRREMAIRSSLGASPKSIIFLMFRSGYKHIVVGLILGAIGGMIVSYFMQGIIRLYHPNYLDVLTVYVCLFIVSSISIAIPSIRMARLHPIEILRTE